MLTLYKIHFRLKVTHQANCEYVPTTMTILAENESDAIERFKEKVKIELEPVMTAEFIPY